MATVTADQSATTYPVYKPMAGAVGFAYGVYEIAAALSKADIVQFCRVPACKVIDGFLRADDLDTGAEALEFDVGHDGDGTTAADPDAFLNSGVITGDIVAEVKAAGLVWMPFNGVLKDGPLTLVAETLIDGVVTAAATSGGTGTLYVGAYYIE